MEPGTEAKFIQIMKYLDIQYYCMVPQAVLSLTAVGRNSGIVLHLGALASGLVHVVDGKVKQQYRLHEDWLTSVAEAVRTFMETLQENKKEQHCVLDGGNAAELEPHLVEELKQNPSFTGFLKTKLPENDLSRLWGIYLFSFVSLQKPMFSTSE